MTAQERLKLMDEKSKQLIELSGLDEKRFITAAVEFQNLIIKFFTERGITPQEACYVLSYMAIALEFCIVNDDPEMDNLLGVK
jgi:hypothetical protein